MQKYFNEITDSRHSSYVKHRLQDILLMIMCAVLCGLDELGAVMAYTQNKADFLQKILEHTRFRQNRQSAEFCA